VRILLVEDEIKMARAIRRGLEQEGYAVDAVGDGEEALFQATEFDYDAIVLDLMLPGVDGLSVCRSLRSAGRWAPVLVLTARDAVEDRIRGLDAGADDYLVKPFAFGELLARLRALGRRHLPDRSAVLEAGDLRLDTASHTLAVDGTRVELRAKEFAVLQYFMLNPGRLLTRTQVEEHVWNYDFQADSNLVEAYIARIRRKLAQAGAEDPFVTVRGAGYRFEP
jgi:two-component system, OmpR family, response regulator